MCNTKTTLVSVSTFVLIAASFCMNQVHAEKKWVTTAKLKVKLLAERVQENIFDLWRLHLSS